MTAQTAASAPDVLPGQQYHATDGTSTVWQVVEVIGDPSGIRHARMINVAQPLELRTLTCCVLTDPDFYHLLSDGPEHGAAIGQRQAKVARRRPFWLRRAA